MSTAETKRPFYKTLHFRFISIGIVAAVILLIIPVWLLSDSMNYAVESLMYNQLMVDLNYLEDELEDHTEQKLDWNRRDGGLYIGEKLIGDGTKEHADIWIFSHCERETGSYYYSFVKTEEEKPLSPAEGHYLRVAGSTLGVNGERIEGTYIEKEIADLLENSPDGECFLISNVAGRRIRTLYRLLRDEKGQPVGVLAAGRSEEELRSYIHGKRRTAFLVDFLLVLVVFAGIGIMLSRFGKKLELIKERLDVIGSGQFPEKRLLLSGNDELDEVVETINRMTDSLREKKRMGADLLVAGEIQQRLLPSVKDSRIPADVLDIAASMQPEKEVGGDLYDYFMVDDRNLIFTVADVSGEGLPASLFMVRAKTLIKSYAQMQLSPEEIMERTNRALCEGNEEEFFVTAWLGMLNLETGLLRYVNAAHNPPVIRRGDSGFELLCSDANFVLAGFEGTKYVGHSLALSPGDQILLYTDGVTEALSREEEFFGTGHLCACLEKAAGAASRELIETVSKELAEFCRSVEQNDDITMLALQYKKRITPSISGPVKEFEAADAYLPEILWYTEKDLKENRLPEEVLLGLLGVTEEIFLNIAHYAYGGAHGSMTLEIRKEADTICLIFTDTGIPFNPLTHPDPDTTSGGGERKIGGLGIFMVRNYADQLSYRYEGGKNILTVSKHYVPEEV